MTITCDQPHCETSRLRAVAAYLEGQFPGALIDHEHTHTFPVSFRFPAEGAAVPYHGGHSFAVAHNGSRYVLTIDDGFLEDNAPEEIKHKLGLLDVANTLRVYAVKPLAVTDQQELVVRETLEVIRALPL